MVRGKRSFAKLWHTSGRMARERLQLLLAADRIQCTPELLEQLQEDLSATVSKYMEVQRAGVNVSVRQGASRGRKGEVLLCATIPVRPGPARP